MFAVIPSEHSVPCRIARIRLETEERACRAETPSINIHTRVAVWKTFVLAGQHQMRMKSLAKPVVLVVAVRLPAKQCALYSGLREPLEGVRVPPSQKGG